jgi:cytochrome b561
MATYALDPARQRYSTVAMALHWAIAVLIVFNLSVGFFMEGLAPPLKWIIVPLHFSSGITVLTLSVLRLVWRLTHQPPPLAAHLSGWERASAHAAHWIMYVLMFALPLTGWITISAHPQEPGGGPLLWGLVPLPPIAPVALLDPTVQKSVNQAFATAHSIGGYLFLGLFVLHVAGALKHQFFDGERQLARMGIGRLDRRRQVELTPDGR